MKQIAFSLLGVVLFFSCQTEKKDKDNVFITVANPKGPTLGYSPESGVKILEVDGVKFKDLNKNGKLDVYEDWRFSADERAEDLASKMSIDQIAGLMLYSLHQAIPAPAEGFMAGHYNGKPFKESGAQAWDLTDEQKSFLTDENLRHFLITTVESPEVAAKWSNNVQAFAEGLKLGIPNNTASDPRNTVQSANKKTEFNAGAGGEISLWPDGLAMAATFDPELAKEFGNTASQEYRALGITTTLSPQIDLGSEPRWYRISGTFGESCELSADMARGYIDGFQTSSGKDEIKDGWGLKSVNTMAKHWPSGGAEEGGRDAHFAYGKFAVYPGKNFRQHPYSFTDGAFKLNGGTKSVSSIMPYYTITFEQDTVYKENVGNGYSQFMITNLLRGTFGFDGVVCTDWGITWDEGKTPDEFNGKPWGMEAKTVEERHYRVIMAGVDQFGGNNYKAPVLTAYQMGVKEHGEEYMQQRFRESAIRILKNMFRIGLFENPYLDPETTKKIVGNPDFMQKGYEAQVKSVILLKNKKNVMPVDKKQIVYVPKILFPSIKDWWGNATPEKVDHPVNMDIIKGYYIVTDDPAEADFSIVFVNSPNSDGGGYSSADRKAGGNGYIPISLQYGAYTADKAREHSIAAGDPVIDPTITNRSYKGKSVTVANTKDLNTILDTKKAMGDKPVIVVVNADRPLVLKEFENQIDGLIIRFGISEQAVMDIISGTAEPSGLLPVRMPADMETVETQDEDVPFDMIPYVDSEKNTYDFAFGLNWSGVIRDARTEKYGRRN